MVTLTAHDCTNCGAVLVSEEPYEEGDTDIMLSCSGCDATFQAKYEDNALVILNRN